MTTQEKINFDLKQAMRDKDTRRLNVLRSLKTAFTNASLQKGSINEVLSETEVIQLVRKQVAQREDSIKQFKESNRDDVIDRIIIEQEESKILQNYLPVELDDEKLGDMISGILAEYESPTKKDMGSIIKKVIERVNGQADNKRVSKMVGERL